MDGIAIETDLREICVEAMTDEFRACMAEDELLDRIPIRLFDACLSVLGDHADGWADGSWSRAGAIPGLLAALKEDE